jgi:site-specific DNA-methyltransferase (adenine-specific)
MPYNFIDLTVTSPPYDNLREYNGYSFPFEDIAKELFRITKQGGVVVWVVGDATVNGSETGTSFKQALYFKEIGFNLHDTMIYWKNAFAFPESNRYSQNFEYMFVLSKSSPTKTNIFKLPTNESNRVKNKNSCYRHSNGETLKMKYETGKSERNKENIWIYEVGYQKTTKDDVWSHPAMFPEQMVRDHIVSWSNENDLVYDPFMGSGTTAKMAHLQKRNWIGSEISAEYVEIANKRLQPYLNQTTLF